MKEPVGFNRATNPWNPEILEIDQITKKPKWVLKYFKLYRCIDRLIIIASRDKYNIMNRN